MVLIKLSEEQLLLRVSNWLGSDSREISKVLEVSVQYIDTVVLDMSTHTGKIQISAFYINVWYN